MLNRRFIVIVFLSVLSCMGTVFAFDYSKALSIRSADYPNAMSVTVEDITDVEYEENGNSVERSYSLVKPITEKARKEMSALTFYYNSKYQTFDKLSVKVISPCGTVREIPLSNISDATIPEIQAMNIYEDSFRQKVVSIGDLESGSLVECTKEIRTRQMIRSHYSDVYYMQDTAPVLHCRLSITGPISKPIRYFVKGKDVPVKKVKLNDRISYTWELFDVPQILTEPQMLLSEEVIKLAVSTFEDWRQVSRYNYEVNKNNYDMNEAIRSKVRSLTDGLNTEEEKILAIHHYLSKNIRYMGSSMDVNSFIESHKATYTFEKGYGVCRDKALLMTVMMREAGIECCELLINPSSETFREVPNINFAHVICMVKTKSGQTYYLDPTTELSAGLTAGYAGDRDVLPVAEKGQDLFRIPPTNSADCIQHIISRSCLSASGKLTMDISMNAAGDADMGLRYLARAFYDDEKMNLFLSARASAILSGSVVENIRKTNPEDLSNDFTLAFSVSAANYGTKAGNFYLVPLPQSNFPFDFFVSSYMTSLSSLKERNYAIHIDCPISCLTEDRLTLPEGYKLLSLPPGIHLTDGPVRLEISSHVEKNEVVFRALCAFEKRAISPEEYHYVKQAALLLGKFYKNMIILEKI